MIRRNVCLTFIICAVSATSAFAGPVVREATGVNAAALNGAVTAFRNDLGNPNNGSAPGSQNTGRREITWDGDTMALNMTPGRGVVLSTPGTGFAIVASASAPDFAAFSGSQILTILNSNVMEVSFVVPGNSSPPVPAAVTGFGAVFTDVDTATTTKLEFYAPDGALLYERFVQATSGTGSFSFLGVSFNTGEVIARVRIISGNAALGPAETGNIDVVAMDDFIYGEPVSTRGLSIAPATGRLYRTGAFDIVVSLVNLPSDIVSARVRLNGTEVTNQFRACAVHARNAEAGDTFRCPAPRGFLPPGDHVFQLEMTLRDQTRVRNAVRWTIINAEP